MNKTLQTSLLEKRINTHRRTVPTEIASLDWQTPVMSSSKSVMLKAVSAAARLSTAVASGVPVPSTDQAAPLHTIPQPDAMVNDDAMERRRIGAATTSMVAATYG